MKHFTFHEMSTNDKDDNNKINSNGTISLPLITFQGFSFLPPRVNLNTIILDYYSLRPSLFNRSVPQFFVFLNLQILKVTIEEPT